MESHTEHSERVARHVTLHLTDASCAPPPATSCHQQLQLNEEQVALHVLGPAEVQEYGVELLHHVVQRHFGHKPSITLLHHVQLVEMILNHRVAQLIQSWL